MKESRVDVLIIGAGPSGCVAASYLYNAGYNVKLVEKNSFPRFVIGESLLPSSMSHFEEAGLLDVLKKQGYEIKRGARFMKNGVVCNFDFSKKHGEGWNWTWQVPRADFDNTMAMSLVERGVDLAFELEVVAVDFSENGNSVTTIRDNEGVLSSIHAKFIIDSSGYGRVLPRLLGLDKPSTLPQHSSLFTHVNESRRPKGEEGTIITFDVVTDEVWLWVIPFSNGITSIGFVGPTTFLESYKGSASERLTKMMELSNHYFDRFNGLEYEFEPVEIKNYSKSVSQLYGKGYALTGNSAEFLDPVFSSGVAFATEAALRSAKMAARQLKGEHVDWETEYSNHLKEGVEVFSTYVKEWYTGNLQKIFFHRPENPKIKEQICGVLAGYVWDKSNPFVKNHHRLVKTVARVIDMEVEGRNSHDA
ncbi:NAD(P)/FAD-dependent oxidoreductase [Constantimarinum furrinae]|uniref:Pyridine nucleotide-disulfide oxidoreductase n=1 Tax=Constantimarinum furrinae TaxID=2562285 RepID=A0A7G8PTW2_9FLAO|nr:NAD(P)/FAD-dependent oxidoreductase [Constantimarinum furrinae]QNJ97778.1 pyridine nucleotide-disulfide oxidoreductase [Constantimarinum furrinae]